MNILIVAATIQEIQPVLDYLDKHNTSKTFFDYQYNNHKITPLITGVGQFMMGFALPRYTYIKEVDIAINAGISGAFDRNLSIGQVVEVIEDRFADLGIEEANGSFTDVYEMKLSEPNLYPLKNGQLVSKTLTNLPSVTGITVNKVHGTDDSAAKIYSKYRPQVESMEGAAFMYACQALDVDHIQVKAISNYVENRDKSRWDISIAVAALNDWLIDYINKS